MQVFLANIQAAKIGSSNRAEEPFGFDAREYIRERAIGKKCEFTIEHTYSGRDYGILVVDGENIAVSLVRQGLAKVLEKKGGP